MTKLLPHETELTGLWIEIDGQVRGDAVCDRIASLTGGILDIVQDHPTSGGWVKLYRAKEDGRYWERSYPQSELHGGGPPSCAGSVTVRWKKNTAFVPNRPNSAVLSLTPIGYKLPLYEE